MRLLPLCHCMACKSGLSGAAMVLALWRRQKYLAFLEIAPRLLIFLIRSLDTIPTELSRLADR